MSSPLSEFDHLRISLADIKKATNKFADDNIIGSGRFGNVYKGKLCHCEQWIDVAVRRLDRERGQGDKEFWNEIQICRLTHGNLVAIVGFCEEDDEKIIVNKYQVNGSLRKYISDPTLTWLQRLEICVGAARALSYLHCDTGHDYDVIHCNIKSSKILLDENWDAKLSGFGYSINNLATRRNLLVIDHVVGTMGYIDPRYTETGTLTHKYDVYSFGVVLFQVLCGRRAFAKDAAGKLSIVPMATRHYEEGKLVEIIDPYPRNQMHPESFKIFSDTAYHCLKEERAQRPDMEKVVKRLEKAWDLQWKHENPEPIPVVGTSRNHLKGNNLDHMRIPLAEIELATDNFSETHFIGSGGYGRVYIGELDHFDSDSSMEIEGKSESEFPKRRSTVAIKCIVRADRQGEQSFNSEIALLTKCKHPNIVSLLGFCDDASQQILVYEHAFYGSLNDYLGNTDNVIIFTWVQRIQLCLDIANGLNYLHSNTKEKRMIVHRDIKSGNILLGKNQEAKIAKIADFGLSRIQHTSNQASNLGTCTVAGTDLYLDPEYSKTGVLTKESDIYSFGVVVFEILSGRSANDDRYHVGNDKGLPSTVRRLKNERKLKEIVDPVLMEETGITSFTLNRGPNQESLDAFLSIAYQCLTKTRAKRPTMKVTIEELEKALYYQEMNKDKLKVTLEDIKKATQNFSDDNLIGRGGFGKVYKGEVNGITSFAAKRLDGEFGQGNPEFLKEIDILLEYKNDNVIGLVGYCDESEEKIIVYEYASRSSLDQYLSNTDLTWIKRLKICIDVASGLEFLHGGFGTQNVVLHRDIKSGNILLTEDWKPKISDFGLSSISLINKERDYVVDNVVGTLGYVDPLYFENGSLSKHTDIYSFGVVLLEIVSGRLITEVTEDNFRGLTTLLKRQYEEGKYDEMVFKDIKEQIAPNSLTTFLRIANQCLHDKIRDDRPTAGEVVLQLKKALEFQVDHEEWEPKLPKDYKEFIRMSKSPEIDPAIMKEDLYNMLFKGIILQHGKLLLSFKGNGKRNEMISAKTFSYRSRSPHKWQSLQESRFHKVAEMLDTSDMMIKIKTRPQFLSPDTMYGVHLVFKFRDSISFLDKPMYVNLKYTKGSETLHAYFATKREGDEDGWMMIELYRFMNDQTKGVVFKCLIESLSPYYCTGDDVIYVEGIEFRAIDNVEHTKIENSKEVQLVEGSNSKNVDQVLELPSKSEEIFKKSDDGEKLLRLSKTNENKHLMLSAKTALCNSSDSKLYKLTPSNDSRFQEVIEFLPQEVFRMNCTIKGQNLSPEKTYVCYLVFKLSKECQGFHCPLEVRDLFQQENKEADIVYFKTPSPWNLHDITQVPKQREDGWMEVNVWKSNSDHAIKNDTLRVNLKFTSYERTMSGLIVCGLEFRTM